MEINIKNITDTFKKHGICLLSVAEYNKGETEYSCVLPFDNCHNCYSVAKAFTVTAIGMLCDEGKLTINQRVVDLLGHYLPKDYDPLWEKVRVADLLAHKFGISEGFLDIDAEDPSKFGTDYLKYCFTRELYEDLFDKRTYSDGAYYLLSRIVSEVAGENLCSYLMSRLFVPLGFKEVAWSVCPLGHSMGATGLYIRTDDMLKLGVLYLENGICNGKRIISENWCKTVLDNGFELKERSCGSGRFAKSGMYGQMLYICKNEGKAIAWHAHDRSGAVKKALAELEM